MKRFIAYLVSISLIFGAAPAGVYALGEQSAVQNNKAEVFIKPEITVSINGDSKMFKDEKGRRVYPLMYGGTVYLPVRAISEIMDKAVEWDSRSKTIYIGKTLSDPNGSSKFVPAGYVTTAKDTNDSTVKNDQSCIANAYVKKDFIVMYDFVIQNFEDATGMKVYPIVYNGSTYLPVRAASRLIGSEIKWDGNSKTVAISKEQAYTKDDKEVTDKKEEAKPVVKEDKNKKLKDIFDREETLYYEATSKISEINTTEKSEDKQAIAKCISQAYIKAQAITLETKELDKTGYSKEALAAYDSLLAYAESTEYYILIMENISYMAATGSDYSILAETFLHFAMESQEKMKQARTAIQGLTS